MQVDESAPEAVALTLPSGPAARLRPVTNRRQISYLAVYIAVHGICVFLYAVLGKGFAYAGHEPVFVGEALLVYGLCVAFMTGRLAELARTPTGALLAIFSLWELARTLPFLSTSGIFALRDAMLWGYSLFAWVAAAIVVRWEKCLGLTLTRYRRYGGIMLILMFACFLATRPFSEYLPKWPGTEVTIPFMKPGDMCVHAASLIVFVLVGLGTRRTWWFAPALCAFIAGGMASRGGFLAGMTAVGFAFLFYPDFRRLVPLVPGLLLGLGLLLTSNLSFQLTSSERVLSTSQLVKNFESVFAPEDRIDQADLESTRQWRLNWWARIFDYTFRGPYFWTGKGYGINLAVSDGIAGHQRESQLRSPHNSHLTFLARSGVPGAFLWIVLQTTWAVSMLRACRTARRRGAAGWAKMFVWLLAYWLAFMINAAFDVSFEGPTCGIPFWTVFGLGWGGYIRFRQVAGATSVSRHVITDMAVGHASMASR